jgi:hypothetical protein
MRVICRLVCENMTYTHTFGRTPLDKGSARRRDLHLTTHSTHKTDIHASGGIRTRSPSKRAAADRPLRPRGHRDWPVAVMARYCVTVTVFTSMLRVFSVRLNNAVLLTALWG